NRCPRPSAAGVALDRRGARSPGRISGVEERLALYIGLGGGAVDRLTEFRWAVPLGEEPGGWARAGADAPADAVRGYPFAQIMWGLDDELWRIELDGALRADRRVIHGERGRLVRRIEAWEASTAADLIDACALRVRDAAVGALSTEGHTDE